MTQTLFDLPLYLAAEGPGEPGAAWWVWCPYVGALCHFEPELAAKYQQQGCFTMLAEEEPDGIRKYPTPKPLDQYPDPEPDDPPYGDSEIVWYYRAAYFQPEAYNQHWERIADWLRATWPGLRPEDVAEEFSKSLGRWGGGFDLESHEMDRIPTESRQERIPF